MGKKLKDIIALNIMLEKTVGELYRFYAGLFPEDEAFWMQIFREEMEHAKLLEDAGLRKAKEIAGVKTVYPHTDATHEAIDQINAYIEKGKSTPPTKREACEFALHLESSASEFHLQYLIKKSGDDDLLSVFKQLNGADENHARRIAEYMRERT